MVQILFLQEDLRYEIDFGGFLIMSVFRSFSWKMILELHLNRHGDAKSTAMRIY